MPKGATPLILRIRIAHQRRASLPGCESQRQYCDDLNTELKNGEQVEILTGREERPRQDWLNPDLGYVKSTSTRQDSPMV